MLKSIDPSQKDKFFDILIIGSGPGGLTASIYAARAELRVAFIEGNTPGGKVTTTSKIENYPGFSQINGADLALNMLNQATNLKAQYIYGWVTNIIKDEENNLFCVTTKEGQTYFSKVVIVATGMKERKLGLPREKEFEGHGISYCAVCDGSLYANKDVAVDGGGNSAVQESLYLCKMVKTLYLIHRREQFRADQIMVDELKQKPNVKICTPYIVTEYLGDKHLTGIKIKNVNTSEEKILPVECLFPFIGFNPATEFITNFPILNDAKQIITNERKETVVPGLFAVGDVTTNPFRQITTATSDGTTAALAAIDYINKNAKNWNW